ncbi:MAG TPA: helix-turn-helix domain-containing protein, partial [Nocardioides sp.]
EAAGALGLVAGRTYRVAAAPLFAVWSGHPPGPEDVVATRHGPIHAIVLTDADAAVTGIPCGIGAATSIDQLDHSFRTALVALRLCAPPSVPTVVADEFGALVGLLADAPADLPQPDADRVEEVVARHVWGLPTVEALVRTSTVRQAARLAGVHHSTMQARLDSLVDSLGFDPGDGFGRTRLASAYLVWRLRSSTVLDLPPPAAWTGTR